MKNVNRKERRSARLSQSSAGSESDNETNPNGKASKKGPRARVQPRPVARKSTDSEGESAHEKQPSM